ncbi:MAG: hypothetical protein MZV70_50290 [Desulfobacterales bacterium]|nr:hypothetical protein [Desulfobacterales bacterium]
MKREEAEGLARLGLRLAAEELTGGGTVGFWHEKLAQALLGERRFAEAATAATEKVERSGGRPATKLNAQPSNAQSILLQALLAMSDGGCRPPGS